MKKDIFYFVGTRENKMFDVYRFEKTPEGLFCKTDIIFSLNSGELNIPLDETNFESYFDWDVISQTKVPESNISLLQEKVPTGKSITEATMEYNRRLSEKQKEIFENYKDDKELLLKKLLEESYRSNTGSRANLDNFATAMAMKQLLEHFNL